MTGLRAIGTMVSGAGDVVGNLANRFAERIIIYMGVPLHGPILRVAEKLAD